MKRPLFFAALAAMTLAAAPAMADDRGTKRRALGPYYGVAPGLRAAPLINGMSPESGVAGTTVTIRGTGFTVGTMIVYGGQLIAPTVIKPKRIKFEIPRGAVDGKVKLRVPGMRRALAVGSFEVDEPDYREHRRRPVYAPEVFETGWAKNRSLRRARRIDGLRGRWNRRFLVSPQVQRELNLHGRRIARLERMKRLARAYQRPRLARRIKAAIRHENRRHARKMNNLRARLAFSAGVHIG